MPPSTNTSTVNDRIALFLGIGLHVFMVVFLARLVVDTGVRVVYPFLPQLSAGLGLSIEGFGWLIALRAFVGIAGPIWGVMADRYGRRLIMAGALCCQAIAAFWLTFTHQWWAALPMILLGLAAAFVPVGHAYLSDLIPYQKRGRVLAAIEFSWALTGIVMLPLAGWLIENTGWRTPFWVLSLLSMLGAVFIWNRLPASSRGDGPGGHQAAFGWSDMLRLCQRRNVQATIGVSMLVFLAQGCLITIWGVWLNEDFGFTAIALGIVATTISVLELAGSGGASLFIDRLGKKRGSLLGLGIAGILFLLLPLTQNWLWAAIGGVVLLSGLMEYTIVALIPLYSAQAPEARATVFSLMGLGTSMGIAIASPIATNLWSRAGLWAITLVSAVSLGLALVLAARYLSAEEVLPEG